MKIDGTHYWKNGIGYLWQILLLNPIIIIIDSRNNYDAYLYN